MPFKTDQEYINLKRKLTLRYVTALCLVACVMMLTYATLRNEIARNEKDAYIVNISGMQRMLSQRIALFSREIYHAPTAHTADIYATKMRAALDKMQSHHTMLSTGVFEDGHIVLMSDEMREIYFSADGINARLEKYTSVADQFLNIYEERGQEAVRETELMQALTGIARNGLLDELNRAVFQYQNEAEAKIRRFEMLETIFLVIGLMTLCLEVIFIFRPMVLSILQNVYDLRKANGKLIEFSWRISHDLRAPIVSSAGLVGAASRALESGDNDFVKESLGHAKASLKKLEVLIDDIVTLTKGSVVEVKSIEISVSELIEDSLEKFTNLPGFEKLDIRKSITFDKPIKTKKALLQQVVDNLISNAIKYHNPDEKTPYVHIIARKIGNSITISVKDNGIGIPEDYKDKVFGMFQRFHPKVSFGSGLGLYLVQQSAEALGGEIQYTPLEKGSEFTVKFPEL